MNSLPETLLKKNKYFEEVMVVSPEMYHELRTALDNYKRACQKESQTGGAKSSTSSPVDKLSGLPDFVDEETEKERIKTTYLKIVEMELKAGDDSTSNAYRRYETLRLMLYNHIRKGTPLPANETVSSLVKKINASREHYLQKLNDLTHDRVRPETRRQETPIEEEDEEERSKKSRRDAFRTTLKTIKKIAPSGMRRIIEEAEQVVNSVPTKEREEYLWHAFDKMARTFPNEMPTAREAIRGIAQRVNPQFVKEWDSFWTPQDPKPSWNPQEWKPKNPDIVVIPNQEDSKYPDYDALNVPHPSEEAQLNWDEQQRESERSMKRLDEVYQERLNKREDKGEFEAFRQYVRNNGEDYWNDPHTSHEREKNLKNRHYDNQIRSKKKQEGSGLRGVSKRRKKLPRLRKTREWVTVR